MRTATTHIETEKRSAERSRSKLVPELRFKEFEGQFQLKELDEITDITRLAGYEYSKYWKEDEEQEIIALRGYNIGKGELNLRDLGYISNELSLQLKRSRLSIGDIVYPCVGTIGNAVVIEENDKFHIQQNIAKITCNDFASPYYVVQFLSSDYGLKEVYRFNASGAQPNVLVGSLRKYRINIPALPEQQKIASFLSVVDEKIQQLTKKKELLEQYKKGVMQQLFSGKLRFKPAHPAGGDENLPAGRHGGNPYPDWEDAVMQDVFERVKEKNKENNLNVMSISAQQGLVNQLEYFNRYVSAADVTGYYLLKKGDFAYNKSYSKGYPMGAIKRLDFYDKGVVSTLYICFRIKENDDSTFYKEFLDHGGINSELHKIAQEGARNHGLLNMSVIEFFRDIKIPRPSAEEQIVIGKFLKDLSAKIEAVNNQITQTQTFKKGLLQQMFV